MSLSTVSSSRAADIESMVARREVGYSLEAAFYTSREVYDLDLDVIFGRHWLFCATEAELAEPGDYVTVSVGASSVIILRDDDESVRALHNVCRHRGSRIVEEPCGSVGKLGLPLPPVDLPHGRKPDLRRGAGSRLRSEAVRAQAGTCAHHRRPDLHLPLG